MSHPTISTKLRRAALTFLTASVVISASAGSLAIGQRFREAVPARPSHEGCETFPKQTIDPLAHRVCETYPLRNEPETSAGYP